MKQLSDYVDILVVVPFCLGYLWAAGKFCMKFLGASKRRERLFLIISFCSLLLRNILGRRYPDLYSFFAVSGSIFFVGLVMLFFRSDREKRIFGGLYSDNGYKAGIRVLRFSFRLSDAVFSTYGKKDSGTAFWRLGRRTGQRYWLLLCHICDIFDVQTS